MPEDPTVRASSSEGTGSSVLFLCLMVHGHFSCPCSLFHDSGNLLTQLTSGLEHFSPVGLLGESLKESLIFSFSLAINGFSTALFVKVTK